MYVVCGLEYPSLLNGSEQCDNQWNKIFNKSFLLYFLMTSIFKMQASEENMVRADGNEALPPEGPETITSVTAAQNCGGGISTDDGMSSNPPDSVHLRGSLDLGNNIDGICRNGQERASEHFDEIRNKMSQADIHVSGLASGSPIISGQISETNRNSKSHAVSFGYLTIICSFGLGKQLNKVFELFLVRVPELLFRCLRSQAVLLGHFWEIQLQRGNLILVTR